MSINTDGPKKQGKFLKRGSKLLKHVKLNPFSFTQISDQKNIDFDNYERTIIHAKFHDPSELERGIKPPTAMNEVLNDPTRPPQPIIMPADFTEDWHNERLNSKRRALGFEDEDDFDFPDVPRSKIRQHQKQNVQADTESPPTIAAHPTNLQSVVASDDAVAMNAEELVNKARPVSIVEDPYARKPDTEMPPTKEVPTTGETGFIPLPTSEDSAALSAEDQAIATYKLRAELEQQNAVALEEMRTSAKAEGYKDGFRVGEEKGVVAGQRAAGEIFQRVTELIHEFEGLKRNVLENIQKNFYELSQAVAESLLEREFSIRPESFAKVLEKVVKDTVTDNDFKIRLHPETWQRVIDLKVPSLEGHLVKDSSVAVGEFKVESNLTVVDGSTKKIISQMLQNVDMNLFEETKIAG